MTTHEPMRLLRFFVVGLALGYALHGLLHSLGTTPELVGLGIVALLCLIVGVEPQKS